MGHYYSTQVVNPDPPAIEEGERGALHVRFNDCGNRVTLTWDNRHEAAVALTLMLADVKERL